MSDGSAAHWERFGFRDDPYYVIHLPVDAMSKDLFVGRQEDYDRLLAFVLAYPAGKTMVEGPPGVGKTSLVNLVQQTLYERGDRFPLFDVVEVPADTTRESFFLTVLSGIISSLRQAYGDTELTPDPRYSEARGAVTSTLQHLATGSFSATLGVHGMGVGGEIGRTSITRTPLGVTLPTLVTLCRGLIALVRDRGFSGVTLPVNNLDTLDPATVRHVLNVIRDPCSAIEGAHWLFISGAGTFADFEANARRVSETFTANPIALNALAWPEVAEALARRRTVFATHPDARLPISESVARFVYDAAGGELRFTFARLSRTVLEFSARFPSERTIPDELALALLTEWAQGHLIRHPLTPREREVLEYVRQHGSIRARDHAALGVSRSQQLSQLLRALEEKSYLRAEIHGTAREYRLSRAAALAFLRAAE